MIQCKRMLRRHVLRSFLLTGLLLFVLSVQAQDNSGKNQEDSIDDLYAELDSLFASETIPDDLFSLVDSLLALDSIKYSTLNFRLGYVSNIVSAGRDFGFEEYGFSPGMTFYHHTGLFGSLTGYWSNTNEPGYYLQNVTLGYLMSLKDKWNLSISHDFYLYNDTLDSHSFDKSAQAAIYYQHKWADIGLDYSFLYGNETAHRLTSNVNGRIQWKTSGFIDRITILPGASFQWGNADVFYLRQPRTAIVELYEYVQDNDLPSLTRKNYISLAYLLESDRQLAAAYFLSRKGYEEDDIQNMINLYYDGQIQSEDTFGFMNYSFSLPVSITSGKWNLLLNYTYSIPVALPGEEYEYPPSGYFSASLSYAIFWKK